MGVRPIIRSNKTALIDGHVPAAIHVERLAGGEAGMRSAEEADGCRLIPRACLVPPQYDSAKAGLGEHLPKKCQTTLSSFLYLIKT